MTNPDYLVIGSITKDLVPGGYTLGGTVAYGAITAANLGKRAAIVTSAEPGLSLPPAFEHIQCALQPARRTTTFRNVYVEGTRQQYVVALPEPIGVDNIPAAWRRVPLVHLGPLAGEIDESLVHQFPESRVVATPQGWLRSWDPSGRVSRITWPGAGRLLPHLAALVLSEEDVGGDLSCIERFADMTRTLVLTNGARGATVYHAGQVKQIPTRPAQEREPTGAGDVFAAAFLIRLHETALASGEGDPWEAARFANVVASFSVEGSGFSAIPGREQVDAYLAR